MKITSQERSTGSDFLTDEVKIAWAKAIVESQSAENDAISGATLRFSASAVKEAVTEIKGLIASEAATAKEAEIEKDPAYGNYLVEKETDFSKIRVSITAQNGKITDVNITSEAKTTGSDFLTEEIKAAWAKSIVENQTAETDAITGASLKFSAGAVKEAVAEILDMIQ